MEKQNFVVIKDLYDGEVFCHSYEHKYEMMREVCNQICFSDCCDGFEILMIVFEGRPIKYVGWQPRMHYEFRYEDNNEIAYENWFPQWEH
jgi:hypothetical protein